jgi:hypothetical protein
MTTMRAEKTGAAHDYYSIETYKLRYYLITDQIRLSTGFPENLSYDFAISRQPLLDLRRHSIRA